ncbi:hypothetical protein GCM10028775_34090 [Catellatospora paridis]
MVSLAHVGVLDRNHAYTVFKHNIDAVRAMVDAGQVMDALMQRATAADLARLGVAELDLSRLDATDMYRGAWGLAVSALDRWVSDEILRRVRILVLMPPDSRPKKLNKVTVTGAIANFPLGQGTEALFGRYGPDEGGLLVGRSSYTYPFERAYDAVIRSLHRKTFQHPDKIAAGFGWVYDGDLWRDTANRVNRESPNTAVSGDSLKHRLAEITARRNRIVHRSDLGHHFQKEPLSASEVHDTIEFLERVVVAITHLLGDVPTHGVNLDSLWAAYVNTHCDIDSGHAWDCDLFCEISELRPLS